MKKLATVLMLVVAILVGGIAAEAKAPRKSSKGSSSAKMAKVENVVLMKNGKIKYGNDIVGAWEKISGDAYIANFNTGEGIDDAVTDVIIGDKYYQLCSGDMIAGDLMDHTNAYRLYDYVGNRPWKDAVSYDPAKRQLTVTTTDGTYRLPLSQMGAGKKVTWY